MEYFPTQFPIIHRVYSGRSSGQPRSHNVPREPYWLVLVPDLFRDSCRLKASTIKIPKHLYEAWLNGMTTQINFHAPEGSGHFDAHAQPELGAELGDFERPTRTAFEFGNHLTGGSGNGLLKALDGLTELRSFMPVGAAGCGDEGDSAEMPNATRSVSGIRPPNSWLIGSSGGDSGNGAGAAAGTPRDHGKDSRAFVRATKSYEYQMGRARSGSGRYWSVALMFFSTVDMNYL